MIMKADDVTSQRDQTWPQLDYYFTIYPEPSSTAGQAAEKVKEILAVHM